MTFSPYRLVEKAYYDKVDATGLGIFRIVYGGLLLGQALLLGFYRHLIFGDEVLVPKLLSYAWILICLFLIAGFQTRLIAIFNYLLSVYIVLALKTYTYDFDKIMIAMNFLLIFIPVSRVLSVDAVMCQRQGPGQACSRLTSRLSYIVPVFVCLGLPYFDSVYHKFQSYNWMSGLGIWMPLSLTQMTWLPWLNYSLFLDNEFLAKQMTYLVLIFEFLFIFTFYFRKCAILLFFIGVGMHLGILLCFPIPLFALGCVSVYLLLVPPEWWGKGQSRGGTPSQSAASGAQGDPADKIKITLIVAYLVLCVFTQLNFLMNYRKGKQYDLNPTQQVLTDGRPAGKSLVEKWNDYYLLTCTRFLGIGSHTVFLDHHIRTNRYMVSVTHHANQGEFWLPLINAQGHPGLYLRDRIWSRWTSYVMGSRFKPKTRSQEIVNFIEFWCRTSGTNCDEGHFIVRQRETIRTPEWSRDIVRRQQALPWDYIARITKKGDDFLVEVVLNKPDSVLALD